MKTWTPYPSPTPCVRRAWLTLGSLSIDLDAPASGYFCTELDLGSPTVRDVVSNRPDQDGVDDRTQYFGARAITATVLALSSAGARIDDVADNFGAFMVPSARPTLHYVLDRPNAPERTMVVRAAGYQYAIAGDFQREVHLSWVAADPYAYDPTVTTVTAWAGSSTSAGRVYNLIFPRTYPVGTGTPIVGRIKPKGDLAIQPLLRIYGPITAPRVYFAIHPGDGTQVNNYVAFVAGFIINAGEWVDVDTDRHTAIRNSDPTQNVFSSINFAGTIWPTLPPCPLQGATPYTDMSLLGSGSTSGVTQVQAIWQDGYLT